MPKASLALLVCDVCECCVLRNDRGRVCLVYYATYCVNEQLCQHPLKIREMEHSGDYANINFFFIIWFLQSP